MKKTISLKLIFGSAPKAGLALGSVSFLWLMGMYGYEANQAQTPRTLEGIRMCPGVYVGILFAICTVLLIACQLNKRMTIQMADELAERRKKLAAENPAAARSAMKIHSVPIKTVLIVLTAAVFAGCATRPTLKEAYKSDFLIGVAVNQKQFDDEDQRGNPIIKAQFDSISPENALKWESVHPDPGVYDFTNADRYVAFGESNHMAIIGHTLVWSHQTPRWVYRDTNDEFVTREVLLERMHDHIQTVVGRYKGRIHGWDVVNEALAEDGKLRRSNWQKIIGDDYIEKAFQFAHAADPDAELYYNDFSLENEPKRQGAIELIKKLKADGIPITGVGLQGHIKMEWPTVEEEDATISDFAKLGVKVVVTELDVDVVHATQGNRTADIEANAQRVAGANTYSNGLPADVQEALAKRYEDLFKVWLKHRDVVERVTFWGVTDGDSWLNTWGRVNHPLLFDRNGRPKPAFNAVIRAAHKPVAE